ncbi:MAG: histidine ammonia-lyase [Saprospiraceae bacterium]|nr:histidine ammonia-lyase [Saprospiraceae bacterium]
MQKIKSIDTNWLPFSAIEDIVNRARKLALSADAHQKIVACRAYLDQKMSDSDALFYGINTGFGFLQNVKIDTSQILDLQYNLLQSHACGIGERVPKEIVRLMLLLKIQSLSYGHSGVQVDTVQRLIDFYNHDILPVVFNQGSLGASGDLSPLAHLTLPLIGMGNVVFKNKEMNATEVLKIKGWQPIELQSKEGLALINGTQFMSAYGIHCLLKAQKLLRLADIIAALSCDAFDCSPQPFLPQIHQIRPHKGQVKTAETMRNLLKNSEIAEQKKAHVQDPYSFRCIPQVHGASKDTFDYVTTIFEQEMNAVTDNPNIFPDADLILSGGNFHGQPLALGFDFLSIAMAEIGSISERRTYQLIAGQRNLPIFLAQNSGINSGLMIPQYTAASVVSENKQLCTPSSVDSIVSSNGQEDHVSMGANGATKCLRVLNNLEKVLAIELLTAAQALEFRRPLKSSEALEKFVLDYRKHVSFNEKDRFMAIDIQKTISFFAKNTDLSVLY